MTEKSSSNSSSSSDYGRRSRSSSQKPRKSSGSVSKLAHVMFLFVERKDKQSLDLQHLMKSNKVQDLCWLQSNETLPKQEGQFLQIIDKDRDQKLDILEKILYDLNKNHDDQESIILIPDKLTAFFIGSNGKAIKKLMHDANTDIIVLPENKDSMFRQVKITGKIKNVIRTLSIMYRIFEEKNFELFEENQKENMELSQLKFVLNHKLTEFIVEEKEDILKHFCNKFNVTIKFDREKKIDGVSRDEQVMVHLQKKKISGSKSRVQKASLEILELIDQYYKSQKDYFDDHTLKLLIPNQYVTNMIGPGGSTIRQIAGNSGGAQIKIISDRELEKHQQDCIVLINGNLERKKNATALIFEKLESFKSYPKFRERGSPHKNNRRSRSRSNSSKQRNNRKNSGTRKIDSRNQEQNYFKTNDTKKVQNEPKQEESQKFKALLTNKMIQKLTENNNTLLNKIQMETGCTLIFFPGVIFQKKNNESSGQLIEIRGFVQQIKNSVEIIMNEQIKME